MDNVEHVNELRMKPRANPDKRIIRGISADALLERVYHPQLQAHLKALLKAFAGATLRGFAYDSKKIFQDDQKTQCGKEDDGEKKQLSLL